MRLCPLADLALLTDADLTALRQAVFRAEFDADTLAEGERIAAGQLDALRLHFVHAAWREDPSPARSLALLFSYDAILPWSGVTGVLGEVLARRLVETRVLVREGDEVLSAVRLTPFRGLMILSDPLHRDGDAVMGPGPTTDDLAAAMPTCTGRVLDVGCGAGSLALVAAQRGAAEVVGVDLSPRAVALSRINARLNALPVRFVESDLTAAVAGERFDLVVSQPAFIMQPPDVTGASFAHGGTFGDELALRLATALPEVIAPGGAALMLLETPKVPGAAALHARLRAALGDDRLALLVLAAEGVDPEAYSAGYATLVDPTLGARWREVALRYRAHLRRLGVEGFTRALVHLEDLRPANYTITLTARRLRGFDGETLQALRRALALAGRPDEALQRAAVGANPAVQWIEERPRPDSALAPRWVARFGRAGFADRELSEATWVLLGLLDGAASVGDAVRAWAEACEARPDEVRPQVLAFTRDGLARGLLVPRE